MSISNGPRFAAIMSIVILQACATPIGRFKDEDYSWHKKAVHGNYQAVFRTMYQKVRGCRAYVSDGNLYTDIQEGSIDIYLGNILGSTSPWVFGTIKIKAIDPETTEIAVGVTRRYDLREFGSTQTRGQRVLALYDKKEPCDL